MKKRELLAVALWRRFGAEDHQISLAAVTVNYWDGAAYLTGH